MPETLSPALPMTLVTDLSLTAYAAEVLHGRLLSEQLAEAAGAREAWLWHGYLATGKTTLLTSQWKSGKSTLVSVLLARMGTGGVLAGLPVAAGRVAVISEEGPGVWDERCRRLGIGSHVSFFCQPFKAKPTLEQWLALLEAMLVLRRQEGLDLVVIDTLATFLPDGNENDARAMMSCLLPLRDLKAQGVGVLLVHHPRKGASAPGQAARGSGALPGYVDILMEMGWAGRPEDDGDRRRWVRAFARFQETRRQTVLELNADGSDYTDSGPLPDEKSSACAEVLRLVLEEASERLTRRQILEQWPEDYAKPDPGTLLRTLQRAVAEGWVQLQGSGPKTDPFQYWPPERVEELYPGPEASREALERWQQRSNEKFLASLGVDPPAPVRQQAPAPAPPPPAPAAAAPAATEVPVSDGPEKEAEPEEPAVAHSPAPGSPPPPPVVSISPSEPESLPERAPLPLSVVERLRAPEPDPKALEAQRIRPRQWPRG
jgi:hypothetical protein